MADVNAKPVEPLCRLDDIVDGDSAGFTATVDGAPTRLLAVRKGGAVYLYVNDCPHIHAPLDFTPGQFLTADKELILCASHGALFRIEDGACVGGPCLGIPLTAVACTVRDGAVWLD